MCGSKMSESTQCDGKLAIQVWCARSNVTHRATAKLLDAFNANITPSLHTFKSNRFSTNTS